VTNAKVCHRNHRAISRAPMMHGLSLPGVGGRTMEKTCRDRRSDRCADNLTLTEVMRHARRGVCFPAHAQSAFDANWRRTGNSPYGPGFGRCSGNLWSISWGAGHCARKLFLRATGSNHHKSNVTLDAATNAGRVPPDWVNGLAASWRLHGPVAVPDSLKKAFPHSTNEGRCILRSRGR